ncbi:MAG: histidinol-phosphate transaminase [Dehalococcoidales bacterium]
MLRLIRPGLTDFAGYSAATSPETLEGKVDVPVSRIIKLDANENPYGCSPRVNRALAGYTGFHIYPDDGQTSLRRMLSDYCGVDAANIVAASGSNRLIDLLLRLLLEPGDEVINCVPTFGVYAFSTRLCGGQLVEVPRTADFTVDVAAIRAAITARTKMVFIASPNNPTGTPVLRQDILELLATGVPVMVDEAYYEFNGETVAPLVGEYGNLSVLRSFSKWAGLAGLRIGYGLFPAGIADLVLRTKIPYNLNAAALVAVAESLADIDYLMGRVAAIIEERGRLFAELSRIDWLRVVPSSANFILCQVLRGQAANLHRELRQRGILVRYFAEPRLENYIRISVGRPEDTDAVIKVLREIGG